MTIALLKPQPVAEIAEAVHQLDRRVGRPPGSYSPKNVWLRGVIREMRRAGHGCADTFRRLQLVEDPGPEPLSFRVSAETADEIWEDIGGDIRGEEIAWEAFRSAWRRAGNGSF